MTEAPKRAGRVSKYHPVLRPTIEKLRSVRPVEGMVSAGGAGCVHMRVAVGQKTRALTFLHHLFRAAEKRGWKVEPEPKGRWVQAHHRDEELAITNSKHTCSLELRSLTKRVEKEDVGRSPTSWGSRFDYVPREELLLELDAIVGPTEYRDGVRKKLEDRIDDLIEQIGKHFDQCVVRDAERAAAAERRAVEEARYQERLRLMRIEKERDEISRRLLVNWRDARDMREVVTALRGRLGDGPDWLSWLDEWCDRIDPTLALADDPFPALPASQ